MLFDTLDESNFVLFAARYYDNLNCESTEEFENDLDRIKYIKRLLRKYHNGGELRERLILNHITILYNVFYHTACTRMLCYKLEDYLEYLKPFLVLLNYWPNEIEVGGETIDGSSIPMDQEVIDRIRKI